MSIDERESIQTQVGSLSEELAALKEDIASLKEDVKFLIALVNGAKGAITLIKCVAYIAGGISTIIGACYYIVNIKHPNGG